MRASRLSKRASRLFGRAAVSDMPGFDPDYYLARYPDVAQSGSPPLQHYLEQGWREGREPSAGFSGRTYLAANPDVAASGMNPLVHYLRHGLTEGRIAFPAKEDRAGPARSVSPSHFRKINVGCGYDKRDDYLNIDVDPRCEPDVLVVDHDLSGLPQGHFDEVRAWDVLEHIPHAFTASALLDWAALLREGGLLVLQTSSIFGVVDMMRANPGFATEFAWTRYLFGNQAHSGDFHHTGFTERTLRAYLEHAGFDVLEIELVDGWLFRLTARKTFDWVGLTRLPAEDAIRATFRHYLGREASDESIAKYGQGPSSGTSLQLIIKLLISSPAFVYEQGCATEKEALSRN